MAHLSENIDYTRHCIPEANLDHVITALNAHHALVASFNNAGGGIEQAASGWLKLGYEQVGVRLLHTFKSAPACSPTVQAEGYSRQRLGCAKFELVFIAPAECCAFDLGVRVVWKAVP